MSRSRIAGALVATVLIVGGCTKPAEPAAPKPVEAPKPDAPKPDATKPATPAPDAAPAAKSNPECVGPMADAPTETYDIGGKVYERKGSVVTQTTADPDDELIVGQI